MAAELTDLLEHTSVRPATPANVGDLITRGRRRRRLRHAAGGLGAVVVITVVGVLAAGQLTSSAPPDILDQLPSATGSESATPPAAEESATTTTPDGVGAPEVVDRLSPDRSADSFTPPFEVLRVTGVEHDPARDGVVARTQDEVDAVWRRSFGLVAPPRLPEFTGAVIVEIEVIYCSVEDVLEVVVDGTTATVLFDPYGNIPPIPCPPPPGGPRAVVVAVAIPSDVADMLTGVGIAFGGASPSDRITIDRLLAFANDPAAPTADERADLFADEVVLDIDERLDGEPLTVPRDALADRASWQVEDGRNLLDFLAGISGDEVFVAAGRHAYCAGPPPDVPGRFEGSRVVAIRPLGTTSCLQWFAVDVHLAVDANGVIQISMIQLQLWER